MEALDEDECQSGSGTVVSAPAGSYAQLVPSHNNPVVIQDGMHASMPPALPPHLLNVILNKESIDVNEPSLLQEPHHVSLNHLYALSIKVRVFALRMDLGKQADKQIDRYDSRVRINVSCF